MIKKEIEIKAPEKLLPWIGGPPMAASILIGVILLFGFTPDLVVNYIFEALFLYLFCLSYKNRYKAYRSEPNLKIGVYFWIELSVHCAFIVAATIQSAFNVRILIDENGITYRHNYFLVSLIIFLSHIIFYCIDYYMTEKASLVSSCKRQNKNLRH